MYDITNEDTFNHLSYWLQSIDKVSFIFLFFVFQLNEQSTTKDFDHLIVSIDISLRPPGLICNCIHVLVLLLILDSQTHR